MIDFAGIRDGLGIEAPGPDATAEQVAGFVDSLMFGTGDSEQPTPLFGFDSSFSGLMLPGIAWNYQSTRKSKYPVDQIDTVGFDIRSVDGALHTNGNAISGPDSTEFEIVLSDAITRERASELLMACELCPDHKIESRSGTDYFSWGEDGEVSLNDLWAPPFHDLFGRGGRLLLADGVGARSLRTDAMELLVDTHAGAPSLESDKDFVDVAAAAEKLGAVSLTISDRSFQVGTTVNVFRDLIVNNASYLGSFAPLEEDDLIDQIELIESVQEDLPMPGFLLSATGVGIDDGLPFHIFLLAFDSDTDASEGALSLSARAQQLSEVDSASVHPGESGTIGNIAWLRMNPVENRVFPDLLLTGEYFTTELAGNGRTASISDTLARLFISE